MSMKKISFHTMPKIPDLNLMMVAVAERVIQTFNVLQAF